MALVEATVLLASRRKAAGLATLVDRVADPVDAGVAADGLVLRVDEDDLKVLVDAVLVDLISVGKSDQRAASSERSAKSNRTHPVRVEDAEVAAAAGDTLLGRRTQGTLELELVDTLVRRLAVRGT